MASLDTRPDVVDVTHYAGDTLTLSVRCDPSLVAGLEWSAQVRPSRTSRIVDAKFKITHHNTNPEFHYITLPAATTTELARTGSRITDEDLATYQQRMGANATDVLRYTGVYDVQVAAPDGEDPVITLAQGTLVIDLDVTREIGA